jgi:hypothetical protein
MFILSGSGRPRYWFFVFTGVFLRAFVPTLPESTAQQTMHNVNGS